jgi:hypothetical protein
MGSDCCCLLGCSPSGKRETSLVDSDTYLKANPTCLVKRAQGLQALAVIYDPIALAAENQKQREKRNALTREAADGQEKEKGSEENAMVLIGRENQQDEEQGRMRTYSQNRVPQQEPAWNRFGTDQYTGHDLSKEQWARLDNLDRLAGEVDPKY